MYYKEERNRGPKVAPLRKLHQDWYRTSINNFAVQGLGGEDTKAFGGGEAFLIVLRRGNGARRHFQEKRTVATEATLECIIPDERVRLTAGGRPL